MARSSSAARRTGSASSTTKRSATRGRRARPRLDRRAAARTAHALSATVAVVTPRRARGAYAAGRTRRPERSPSIAAEREVDPAVRAGERLRQRVAREEADRTRLERVALQLAAEHAAVEDERVHREPREAEAQPVEHRDERDELALDARLLEHFLDRDLRRRVADVGPADRIQPPPESARCVSRISPRSLPTTAATATFGVT